MSSPNRSAIMRPMNQHPLSRWLSAHNRTAASFAKELGLTQSALSLWLSGQRTPSSHNMMLILSATNGAVTPNKLVSYAQGKRRA